MTISQAKPSGLGPDDGRNPIIAVAASRREEAVGRLLAADGTFDREHARRFLDYAREHAVALDNLWAWTDARGRFKAVVLAVVGAGRSAMVFASQARDLEAQAQTSAVLDFGVRRLQQAGIHLAQTLLDPHDLTSQETFEVGGFHRLATLSYLERPLRMRLLPPKPQWTSDVTVEDCGQMPSDELVVVLDATYEQTLDCPGLRGQRSTADILEGHRSAGLFDPRLWTLLKVNGRPAGVLLLNPAADRSSIELVYLGLSLPMRGRGLGMQLLRHGLHLVGNRTERVMTLAVDETNAPALALYGREQFRTVLRRVAMIRPLRSHED